ncbi:MAG: hypothetical protein HGJ93_00695 [Desulfosarcina sp.]|nr:hypothetical protein [Desulfosarcina sp.]MBC2764504.1 hypothetical protein [Desulfosarcina sp.]
MKPKQEIDRRDMLCPQFKKPCRKQWEQCAWRMENERQYPDGTQVVIKCCAMFWTADEQVNMNNRLAMLQKEMGEVKNANLYHAMAMLGSVEGRAELVKMINRTANIKQVA